MCTGSKQVFDFFQRFSSCFRNNEKYKENGDNADETKHPKHSVCTDAQLKMKKIYKEKISVVFIKHNLKCGERSYFKLPVNP